MIEPKAAWSLEGEKKVDVINASEDDGKAYPQQEDKLVVLALRQFLSQISVGGVRYVVDQSAGSIRRLIWAILVCFGVGFAIYQITEQVRSYASFPVTVKMNINDMPSLAFPTITVCNENAINKSKAMDMEAGTNLDIVWAFSEVFRPTPLDDVPVDGARLIEVLSGWKADDWGVVYKSLYLNFDELVVNCRFDGVRCKAEEYTILVTNYGNCLQFNPYGNLTTEVVGSTNGLQLVLTAEEELYAATTSSSASYRVLVHHKSEVVNNDMTRKGIMVDVNHHTKIKLQSEEIRKLPAPYGSCNDDKQYVHSKCSVLCYEKFILENCGCLFVGSVIDNATVCSAVDGGTCFGPTVEKYYSEKVESTQCDCPQQCIEYIYPYQLSMGTFSDYFFDWMKRVNNSKFTREYMEKNFVVLDVYFDSMKKTEMITQPAYTLLSLLCDIGGALGLILGSTVLTLFEIFDFWLSTCPDVKGKSRNKSKVQVK